MNNVLILLDELKDWEPYYKTNSVLTASEYLKNKDLSESSKLVINLSNDYSYNSEGYYCSLLGLARGHKIIPSVDIINKLQTGTGVRIDLNLQKICYQWIQKNNIQDDIWYMNIYLGTCAEKGLEKIARFIFDNYPSPLLRVGFNTHQRNQIESVKSIGLNELSEEEQTQFANALDNFSKKVWRAPRTTKTFRYNLAILYDPEEKFPPSNKRALTKFLDIAKKMNVNAELITEDDTARLMEFDGLFIRTTTALNHYTFKLAQQAKLNDLVVIDDPTSIIRCTNKVYLNELLAKEKVACPPSMLVFRSNENTFESISAKLGSPFIMKIPDGSFSHGMKKVKDQGDLEKAFEILFDKSAILLAQKYTPTDFDWRIGILNGKPLFACKYYMAKGHWQIYQHLDSGKSKSGLVDTVPIYQVPQDVLRTALKAASLIGKGLYGVDLKVMDEKAIVIEVNDNPSIDHGIEDAILGDEIYYRIINYFIQETEKKYF